MATEVRVPAMGESITTGILATWHVSDGDAVEAGQSLFDLETDKITSEGTAEVAGVIQLKVEAGDEVEIGAVVAEIDTEAAPASAQKTPDPSEAAQATGQEQLVDAQPASPRAEDSAPASDHTHSPAVRRIAQEEGIDPASVEGTGKGGRVTKGDLLSALSRRGAAPAAARDTAENNGAPTPAQAPKSAAGERTSRRKMTPLRRTIAQRLVEAQQTTAMLTTFNEVDLSAVMGLRKRHQEAFVAKHGLKLGFMSFFTKAVVHALKAVPSVNGRIDGQDVIENHFYDIGIAVSTPRGLMVPVIRDCDTKGFAQIEQDIAAYAQKAKDGKIDIADLQGGVFTITNGGIFGSMLSTPILNLPQSGILGMHTIQERPIAVEGQVVIRPMMYLALSYDHRLVDGREAVTFLVNIKTVIEEPARLLFDL